jgi:hypothetical protein
MLIIMKKGGEGNEKDPGHDSGHRGFFGEASLFC